MAQDQARSGEAVRITTASASRLDDIRTRQRRYLASMSLRTICFVGAVIVRDGVFMWILIAGAIFLPYVAVVLANATTTRSDGFALQDGSLAGRQLPTGPTTHQL
ncbi:MAG: DUF3099 domain-containing protein [Nocardioides sp.]